MCSVGRVECHVSGMMSEDVYKTSSTGHIGSLSNQQLSESLVHERLRSEQHRLNYERLRSLYQKLQNDMNMLTTTDETDVKECNVKEDEGLVSEQTVPEDLLKSIKKSSLHRETRGPNSSSTLFQNHVQFVTPPLSPVQDDDKADDILAGIMKKAPQTEILRQCNRWKELYLNLLDEFQQYKYLNDVLVINNDQIIGEKVREANHELDKIRVEQNKMLEELRSKLDNVIRDRLLLQTEIKAIREQLDETNGKLREKTILCETLQRQIDENSMNFTSLSSHEKRCDVESHTELATKLSAAEGRAMFLQDEINEISNSNNKLQDRIFSLIRESTQEITTLRKALSGNEEQVVKAQVDLQHQQNEAIQQLQVQQAYIEDLDKFVTERVEQNNEVSQKVQDFATQVAQETEQTLQLLEDRLQKATKEKGTLEESLVKASNVIQEITEEAKRQRITTSKFIAHIYHILSIPPSESPENEQMGEVRTTLPYIALCDNIVNSINDDTEIAQIYAFNTSEHMKDLLKRVIFWSRQFELQKKRLRERVSQLEQFQMEQKKIALNDIDRYRKKCAFYREILRQLRNKLGIEVIDETLKTVLPPHLYDQARNWLSKYKSSLEQDQQEDPINVPPTTSSTDKFGESFRAERLDPPENISGISQAQHKFGPSTQTTVVRPFVRSNLHSYIRRHERFSDILDNVSKYLAQSEECVDDDD